MPGATVDLSGNNAGLNASADQSKKKIVEGAEAGGKAYTKAFSDGEIGLAKMVAKAWALKKIFDMAAAGINSYTDKIAATAQKYGGQQLEASLSATRANLGSGAGEDFMKEKGAASADERLGFLKSLGEDPSFKYSQNTPERAAAMKEIFQLRASGLIDNDEAMQAAKSGDLSYIRTLIAKRRAGLSKDAQRELNTRQAVYSQDRQDGGQVGVGDVARVVIAGGERVARNHPGKAAIAEAAGLGEEAQAARREAGSGQAVEAYRRANAENRQATKKPNYINTDGR